MDMDRDKMAERILHLTLEILFRLTGEDYTVVKKTSSERCQAPVSERWGRPLSPITGPPLHPPIHEDIDDQKILELTYKMIELLTGEVPMRCQDVTVYFSMEEWEYLEGHKDLYKDVMMEVPQPLTSPVLSSKRTTPERCPRPLLPQDCKQEDPDVPQDHQGEDLPHINTTETYVSGDEQSKEEIPTDNLPDHYTRRSGEYLLFSDFNADDRGITADAYKEYDIISDTSSAAFHRKELSSDTFQHVLSSNLSQTVQQNKNNRSDVKYQRTDIGEKRFSCSVCGACFNQKSSLVRHERSHTEEKPYSCPDCGKCFKQKSNLITHQRTHTGEKRYSCSECGKCFTEKSNLIIHERNHAGEKPFSCPECGKCFIGKSHLVRHHRIHTGEKPFSCSECGKCFRERSNFFRHQKAHTGEKPYSCSLCGKCFMYKSHLDKHQVSHTGE
ncbi:gastrula zinc finger protein XlCGF66.1-like [Anomaloglossus baeobatrachus]|uniref:gastrula zinc finger protein XlCGF66.1-like n=1 Tax=Anomaloglossus baeobatrachus TaxID=238106 RepID=UPI003F50D1D8